MAIGWHRGESGAALASPGWTTPGVGLSSAREEEVVADGRLVDEFLRTESGDAFALLVDRHKERIFRLALAVLGPGFEAEAEEVTQEVFVVAFRQLPSFRGECAFGSWLYRIAQRKAIDLRRSARVRHPHAEEKILEGATPAGLAPDSRAAERQSRLALQAAIRELPDPYPAVLRLFYWLDRSVSEIAEVLNVAPGTVKSHLFRARRLLAGRLKEKGFTDEHQLS